MKIKVFIRNLVFSSLCLALALVLPFLTGQIPEIGSMLCPMHIPVLLCGLLCGWQWGLGVGVLAPLLRSLIFQMPPMYPTAISMAFELAAYGLVSGLLYRKLPNKPISAYIALIIAMIAGRVVWGIVRYALMGLFQTEFSFPLFLSGAVLTAWPGIVLQIVLVPALVLLLEKFGIQSSRLQGRT